MNAKNRANVLKETLKELQRYIQNNEITLAENDMLQEIEEIEKNIRKYVNNAHELRKRISIDTSITGKGLVDLSREGQ